MAELLGARTLLGMRNSGLGSLTAPKHFLGVGWCVEQLLEAGNNNNNHNNNNRDIVARGFLTFLPGPSVIFFSLAF